MESNESYYDRGSMDDDMMEDMMDESSMGGMMKMMGKMEKMSKMSHTGDGEDMGDMQEMEILKKKVQSISEDDFLPVSDSHGNEMCLHAEDYPDLVKEGRGSEVMFIIRGSIKGVKKPMMPGESEKLEVYIWDAAKVHGRKGLGMGMGLKGYSMSDMLKKSKSGMGMKSKRMKFGSMPKQGHSGH